MLSKNICKIFLCVFMQVNCRIVVLNENKCVNPLIWYFCPFWQYSSDLANLNQFYVFYITLRLYYILDGKITLLTFYLLYIYIYSLSIVRYACVFNVEISVWRANKKINKRKAMNCIQNTSSRRWCYLDTDFVPIPPLLTMLLIPTL